MVVEPRCLERLDKLLPRGGGFDAALVTADSRVPGVYVDSAVASLSRLVPKVAKRAVEGGEAVKSLEGLVGLLEGMVEAGLTRHSLAAALGGGSLIDTVGFAAAVYMRGIGFLSLPTTLLAQADAGLGGKTGVNMAGKNLVGAFHPPLLVAIDPVVLRSQGEESYRQGFAELVKHGLIRGEPLLGLLQEARGELLDREPGALARVLWESARVKMGIVSQDPWETRGLRLLLNLGHTVGHAVEKASGYRLSHGEAVSIGLVAEAMLSHELGVGGGEVVELTRGLLEAYGLPTRTTLVGAGEAASLIGLDKKRRGDAIALPLLEEPGRVVVEEVGVDWLRSWVATRLKGSVLA